MHTLIQLIVVLFLTALTHSQNTCRSQLALLQTGTLAASPSPFPTPSREHSFTVPVTTFSVPASGFQITASVGDSVFSAFPADGYDFSLRAYQGQSRTQAKIVLFISNDNSWSSIKISYIIAARSDIQVGFFIVDAFSATSNTLTFSNALVGWSPRTTSVSAAVYLAGLRTSSTSIQNCQITGASVNPANGILVVNVTLGSGGYVEFLYLSYAWWGNSPGLVVASYDPASGSAVQHQYTGLERISSGKMSYRATSFSGPIIPGSIPCQGAGCDSRCKLIVQCVSANGIIANNVCYLCGAGQFYQNFDCHNITCPQNMNLVGNRCVCPSNFHLISPNECSPCPLNSRWITDRCACNEGFYLQNTSCIACPAFSSYDNTTKTCQCNNGYHWFASSCIKCEANQRWDPEAKSCVCSQGFERVNNACTQKCPQNATRVNSVCTCNSGLRNASGVCLPCPPRSVFIPTQNTCLCGLGFYFQNNSCLSCGKNQEWNTAKNSCQCRDGFNKIQGTCQQCSNSTWDGSVCVCSIGFERINSTSCVKCDPLRSWNGTHCACKDTFVSFGAVCFCPLGSKLVGEECVCHDGSAPVNSSCKALAKLAMVPSCDENEELQNGSCICKLNFVEVNGTCSACPEKSASDGKKCVCIAGLFMINGSCVECDRRTRYNQTDMMCYCRPGFFGNYSFCRKCHRQCETCEGPKAKDCLSCPAGAVLRNGRCVLQKAKDAKQDKNVQENQEEDENDEQDANDQQVVSQTNKDNDKKDNSKNKGRRI